MGKIKNYFFSLLLITNLHGQINNVSLLGRWITGECISVATQDDKAYISSGLGMTILDILNPGKPLVLSQVITPSSLMEIEVKNDLVYIANDSAGLQIVDVSDPINPQILSSTDLDPYGSHTLSVSVVGNYAYLALSSEIQILDISDPTSPFEVSRYSTGSTVRNIFIRDTIAFVANGNSGLKIINIKDPLNLFEIGSFNTPEYAYDIIVKDNCAFIADSWAELRIIDISSLSNPQEIGTFPTQSEASSLAINSNLLYLSDYIGIYVFDISNPASINLISYADSIGKPKDLCVSDNRLLTANVNSELIICDVSDINNITPLSTYNTGNGICGINISGGYLYISEHDGLRILDISTRNKPKLTSFTPISDNIGQLAVNGNYAYVTSAFGFKILDISNPNFPEEVNYHPAGVCYSIEVQDTLLFLSVYDQGLIIFDISDPVSPQEISMFIHSGMNRGIVVSQNKVYVGVHSNNGFLILDITNLQNPQLLGDYYTLGLLRDLYLKDNAIYAACYFTGIEIIDVLDPANPIKLNSFLTDGSPNKLTVENQYLYLADQFGGLKVFDLVDPFNLTTVGIYKSTFAVDYLQVFDNLIFAIDNYHGLYIFKNDLLSTIDQTENVIDKFRLFHNYPNPFNPKTIIEFSLPKKAIITLKVYDIFGQEITTLINDEKNSGNYSVEFNALGLSSGVYFYQLKTNDLVETKKMILLK